MCSCPFDLKHLPQIKSLLERSQSVQVFLSVALFSKFFNQEPSPSITASPSTLPLISCRFYTTGLGGLRGSVTGYTLSESWVQKTRPALLQSSTHKHGSSYSCPPNSFQNTIIIFLGKNE